MNGFDYVSTTQQSIQKFRQFAVNIYVSIAQTQIKYCNFNKIVSRLAGNRKEKEYSYRQEENIFQFYIVAPTIRFGNNS